VRVSEVVLLDFRVDVPGYIVSFWANNAILLDFPPYPGKESGVERIPLLLKRENVLLYDIAIAHLFTRR
jgi:hypothetical protein